MALRRLWISMAVVVALAASVLQATMPTPVDDAASAEAATSGSGFDAGNIISDANFFAGNAMSAADVQAFLDGQQAGCSSGYTCLNGYRQNTPSMTGTSYCSGITGQANESAASIITRIGAACGISQRVLLVLLQKEQSLVTSRAPTQRQFERATGFACPDTAPCDSSYGGFFYQVYYAARQFKVYQARPTSYNHRAGQWNNVLFHPNAACGYSSVYIQNQATAGLYNYTPYQPNSAALANLYGTGDGCSAYGNRNFWRMWSDWFGSPTAQPATSFMRNTATGAVYLVAGGVKSYVPSVQVLDQYSALGGIRDVSAATLDAIANGPTLARTVRAPSGAVYFVDASRRYQFDSCATMQSWSVSCADIPSITAEQERLLGSAGLLRSTVRAADGHMWLIQSGTRRELASTDAPAAFGYPTAFSTLSADAVANLPIGMPLLVPGDVVRSEDRLSYRLQAASGLWQAPASAIGLDFLWNAPAFTAQSYRLLAPSAGTLPVRFRDSTGHFVLTTKGVLRVDGPTYGGDAYFTAVGAGTGATLPSAGLITAPHFASEYGSSERFLISGGTRVLVQSDAHYRAIQTAYGVPATVWVTARGGVDGIPQASSYASGTLVRGSSGAVYLIDGGAARHVASMEFIDAMGLSSSIVEVSDSIINGLPNRTGLLSTYGIICGGMSYVAFGGALHPYASADVRARWGLTETTLSADLCSRLTISTVAATQFVYDASGRTYLLEGGKRRYIDSSATFAAAGGTATNRTLIGSAFVGRIPEGTWVRPSYPAGQLVYGTGDGRVWVVDGTRLLHLGSFTTSASLGLSATRTEIPMAAVSAYTDRGTLPSSLVLCGSTAYAAVAGALVPFPASVRSQMSGITFTQLSPTLCDTLTTSTRAAMTQFMQGPDGRVWYVENGVRHWLGGPALQRLGGWTAGWQIVDATVLAAIPAGATWAS